MTKHNRTQAALEMAAAIRAELAELAHIRTRESIRPLYRKRLAELAAHIRAQPIAPRRRANRGRLAA